MIRCLLKALGEVLMSDLPYFITEPIESRVAFVKPKACNLKDLHKLQSAFPEYKMDFFDGKIIVEVRG